MGIGGVHIWNLLILLLVVILLFGTNKLRNIGADLGNAIKGFRDSMKEGQTPASASTPADKPAPTAAPQTADATTSPPEAARIIEGQVASRDAPKT